MDIKDINFDNMRFLSFSIKDNVLYIEYENGYTNRIANGYINRIAIDFESYTYISDIEDSNKEELTKVFIKILSKMKFNKKEYRQYSIIELWLLIKGGVDKLPNICKDINLVDEQLISAIDQTKKWCNTIGDEKIFVLAKDFNNVEEKIIDDIIDVYYELYLLHSYQLFVPQRLYNEFNTNYNTKYDSFFSLLLGKNINNTDIKTFYNPTKQLIIYYLHFVKMFVFQITNDLNHVFFIDEEKYKGEKYSI